jgi:hypothetical protein
MSSLRFRLLTVIMLALVVGVVSQSAAAGSSDARPLLPGSNSALVASALAAGHTPVLTPSGLVRGTALSAELRAAAAGARAGKALSTLGAGFTDTGTTFGAATVFSVTSGDYDADGRLDILTDGCSDADCTGYAFKLYHNNGDGTFSENTTSGLPANWIGTSSWADYDSDGYVDVLIMGCPDDSCSTLESRLYHNNGDGTFTLDSKAALPGQLSIFGDSAVQWADFNNDGRLDLIIGGSAFMITSDLLGPKTNAARLFLNNGDGSFSEAKGSGLPDLFSFSIQAADYDADGHVDVLISGCSDADCSSLVTRLYHNNGDGTFSEDARANLPSLVSYWDNWSDFNGDGLPDIAMSGYDEASGDPVTKILLNDGDGSFSESKNAGLPALNDVQMLSGDFDSDGHVDILFNGFETDYTKYISRIYRNNGDGTFSLDTNAGLPDSFSWFTSGDYNADGGLDLVMYDASPTYNAVIYRNATTSSGGTLSPPDGLQVRLTGARQATFSWKESSSKTQDNSITYNLRVGTTRGASDVVSAMSNANGVRSLPAEGNAGARTFAKVTLPHKGNYYWSVQAVNASLAGSVFARDMKFIVPGRASIKLTESKINTCGDTPLTTTVTGRVNPVFTPVATIILKQRFSPHGSWREIARMVTSHSGVYGFHRIGKASERSFWLKVLVTPKGGDSVTSRAKYVTVRAPASCRVSG